MTTTLITFPDGSSYDQPTALFVNGEFIVPGHKSTLEIINPFTQEAICQVSRGAAEDIDIAIEAARKAFKAWSRTPGEERGALLYKLADLILRDAEVLAKIEVSWVHVVSWARLHQPTNAAY